MSDGSHLLVWAPAPCPKCGARTDQQAETRCRPTQDQSGEYSCPAGERSDDQGRLLQPTAASIAAMDVWIGEEMKRQGFDP